jgi:hypothetical protein
LGNRCSFHGDRIALWASPSSRTFRPIFVVGLTTAFPASEDGWREAGRRDSCHQPSRGPNDRSNRASGCSVLSELGI